MSITITISEEKLDELIKKVMERVKDEILRDIFRDIVDILKEISKTLRQLAEAQRRTEEQLRQLAEAQRRTEEQLRRLTGEVAELKGEVIEYRVISDLGRILDKYGFIVYSTPYNLREVDAIAESDGFYVLIQICKTCDPRDLKQVLRGAEKFKETEGVEPDVLVIFSYTGQASPEVIKEAEKRGIIVEHNIRRLARRLVELHRRKIR